MKSRVRTGFTLIELLVVIAIIAILASILFPVFSRAREKARGAQCASNLKSLGMAVLQYSSDYDEQFPLRAPEPTWEFTLGTQPPTARAGSTVFRAGYWPNALEAYMKNWQVFQCPSGVPTDYSGGAAAGANPFYSFSYNFNGLLGGYHQAGVVSPAACIMFWEGMGDKASSVFVVNHPWVTFPGTTAANFPNRYIAPNGPNNTCGTGTLASLFGSLNGIAPRVNIHTDGQNYAYADGHVKWQKSGSINSTWAAVNQATGFATSLWWDGCCPWYFRPIVQ